MQRIITLLFLCGSLFAQSHVSTRLIADQSKISKGQPFQLGIELEMDDHWHTYWENPGSSGLATSVTWEDVPGLEISDLIFPWPKKFVDDAGFITYGYDDQVLLLANATYNGDQTNIEIKGTVNWLECKEICIPGSSKVNLTLETGSGEPKNADKFSQARAQVPVTYSDEVPFTFAHKLEISDDKWLGHLQLQPRDDWQLNSQDIVIFPGLNPSAELVEVKWQGSKAEMHYNAWDSKSNEKPLYAFLKYREKQTDKFVKINLDDAPGVKTTPATQATEKTRKGLVFILLMAFIGGIILNLMPCVLPVLSLKIMSFIQDAGESQSKRLGLSLVYTLGILLCMIILAIFIIITKMGVGGQFSYPTFNLGMAALMLVMALSFFNVFYIGAPNVGSLSKLNQKTGVKGAFFQGILMTLLSTPCTAPFLGTAYGWALTGTNQEIILVFICIGLGLSAPYVLLTSIPAMLRFLPKPGSWMENLKIFMGFPLLATVIWLISILASQAGRAGVVGTFSFLLTLALAAWIFGQFVQKGQRSAYLAIILVLGVGTWLSLFKLWDIRNPFQQLEDEKQTIYLQELANNGSQDIMHVLADKKTTAEKIEWVPYSEQVLANFREQGRLIFVDFTAEWCATCKANEKLVINTAGVRKTLAQLDVVTMKVDYTNQPQEITDILKSFDRGGVPLYLVYPGTGEAIVLPEVITKDMVISAVKEAASLI